MESTCKPDVKKVYGRALHDVLDTFGLSFEEYTVKKMNLKRKQQLINGLTDISKRVLDAVPISESWPSTKILIEYHRLSSHRMELKVLEGCLNSLKDSGLISEPSQKHFKRPPEKEIITVKPKLVDADYFIPPRLDIKSALEHSASTQISPIDIIGSLSARLKKIAVELDDVGIAMEDQLSAAENKSEKLKQLQQILKSLG